MFHDNLDILHHMVPKGSLQTPAMLRKKVVAIAMIATPPLKDQGPSVEDYAMNTADDPDSSRDLPQ